MVSEAGLWFLNPLCMYASVLIYPWNVCVCALVYPQTLLDLLSLLCMHRF